MVNRSVRAGIVLSSQTQWPPCDPPGRVPWSTRIAITLDSQHFVTLHGKLRRRCQIDANSTVSTLTLPISVREKQRVSVPLVCENKYLLGIRRNPHTAQLSKAANKHGPLADIRGGLRLRITAASLDEARWRNMLICESWLFH